jgi:hypothetical protein
VREPLARLDRTFICREKALYPQFIQGYVPRAGKGCNRCKEAQLAGGAAIDEVQTGELTAAPTPLLLARLYRTRFAISMTCEVMHV